MYTIIDAIAKPFQKPYLAAISSPSAVSSKPEHWMERSAHRYVLPGSSSVQTSVLKTRLETTGKKKKSRKRNRYQQRF